MKNEATEEKRRSKSRIYFGLGYALLVLMALTWALGDAFTYIFIGAAIFFLFLGFRSFPRSGASTSSWQDAQPSYKRPNFFDQLFELLEQFKRRRAARTSTGPRKGVVNLAVIMGIFFIIVAVMIVLGTAGEDDYAADTWASQGTLFFDQQMYDSAVINYRKALSVNPANEEALMGMGNVKLAQQEYDSATNYFDLVLANNTISDRALYGKALSFYYKKSYDASLSVLQEILDVDPNHMDALLLHGDCNYAMNQYDVAIQSYETAYAIGARSFELSNIMGYIYDVQKNYDKALQSYQEALQYDDTNADIKKRVQELSNSVAPGQ